ncbi:MAG: alpha/beta hydrolase [Legionella sp.]|uniref:alpha/beta hydrolase n=1 Tax=Legionella sp. TaxID=459 RepID=UPI00283C83EC|nr:alpha/beta hydrolase [Legionella sp.]
MKSIEMKNSENAVLLIHGLSSSPLEMVSCAGALYKAGFSVRIPFYSTFGMNSQNHSQGVIEPWQKWREETHNDFMQMKKEYKKVFVVGLCMGAIIALDLAIEFEEEIAGLALLSTPFFYDGWAMPWYQKFLPLIFKTPLRKFVHYKEKEPYGVKNEAIRDVIKLSMQKHHVSSAGSSKISATGIYEAYLLTQEVKKNLSKISNPLLIIHAEEDETASLSNVKYIQNNIQAPKTQVVILKDSYHMITLDNEKHIVAQNITDFLNSLLAA